MKNLLLLAILVIILGSCNNQNQDLIKEQLYSKLQRSNDFIVEKNDLILMAFKAANYENPIKVKRWIELAYQEDSTVKDFINYADSINSNATNYSTDVLLKKYVDYSDYLASYYICNMGNFKEYYSSELQRNNYAFNDNNPKFIIIQMINDMLINESVILSYLYTNIDYSGGWGHFRDLTTENTFSSDSAYVFTLNHLGLVQFRDNQRFLTIDSILVNGDIVNIKPKIEFSDILWSIHFDTLQKGNYNVIGRVELLLDGGKKLEYPFEHKFKK